MMTQYDIIDDEMQTDAIDPAEDVHKYHNDKRTDWIVVYVGPVVIHMMTKDARELTS